MQTTFRNTPLQLPLDAQLHEELVLAKARELFARSHYLSGKYPSFNKLMEDPVVARCMRLCAGQMLRRDKSTRG
jgi:hypothetical protein